MLQLGMQESLGWSATAAVCHGVPLLLLGLIYVTHADALREISHRCEATQPEQC